MNSDDAEIIALSRTQIAFLILGACTLVAIGVWLFSLGEEEVIGSMHRDPAIVDERACALLLPTATRERNIHSTRSDRQQQARRSHHHGTS